MHAWLEHALPGPRGSIAKGSRGRGGEATRRGGEENCVDAEEDEEQGRQQAAIPVGIIELVQLQHGNGHHFRAECNQHRRSARESGQ